LGGGLRDALGGQPWPSQFNGWAGARFAIPRESWPRPAPPGARPGPPTVIGVVGAGLSGGLRCSPRSSARRTVAGDGLHESDLRAYALGGLIGPALGALDGVHGPFLAYLGLVTVGAGVALAMGTPATRPHFHAERSTLRLRGFRLAAAGIVFAVLALGVVEGLLPLNVATLLKQGQIGALYVGMSLVVAVAAAATGSLPPRCALAGATMLVVVGLSVAGSVEAIPLWVLALVLAGIGIGMANTSSLGVLLEAVPTDPILTAMIVWSQPGILGYRVSPLAGGAVAGGAGLQRSRHRGAHGRRASAPGPRTTKRGALSTRPNGPCTYVGRRRAAHGRGVPRAAPSLLPD
jgi:hypothetical protein